MKWEMQDNGMVILRKSTELSLSVCLSEVSGLWLEKKEEEGGK